MSEIELEIGGVLRIGEYALTIVDIDRDDVIFKIDQADSDEEVLVTLSQQQIEPRRGVNSALAVDRLPR